MITRWLGGRDVLFQEFGAPAVTKEKLHELSGSAGFRLLDEETAAGYTRDAISLLHRFGFLGAMLWCFGDYVGSIWHEPPLDQSIHERFFGLWHADHSPKPALAEIKFMSDTARREPVDNFAWIDIEPDEFYHSPRENLKRLYKKFRATYKIES